MRAPESQEPRVAAVVRYVHVRPDCWLSISNTAWREDTDGSSIKAHSVQRANQKVFVCVCVLYREPEWGPERWTGREAAWERSSSCWCCRSHGCAVCTVKTRMVYDHIHRPQLCSSSLYSVCVSYSGWSVSRGLRVTVAVVWSAQGLPLCSLVEGDDCLHCTSCR